MKKNQLAIAQAREIYALPSNDDIEIDDKPKTSRVREDGQLVGYWVQAWVWVAASEIDSSEAAA